MFNLNTYLCKYNQQPALNIINKIKGDKHFRELFQGSSIAMGFRIVSAFSSFILFYFLAHKYGASGVGIFSTSWTILMISSVIAKMGFDTSIVRFMSESSSNRSYLRMRKIYKKSLTIVLFISLFVAGIIIAVSGKFTEWFYNTINNPWVVIMAGSAVIPYSLMSLNAESMKGLKKILPYSIHQNITIYLGTLLVLLLIRQFYDGVEMIIIALLIVLIILMISSFSTFRYFLRFFPAIDSFYSKPVPQTRRIIGITWPMMLTNSLFLILNWTDVLMLAAITDDASVGIYNTALKIAALNSLALIAVNTIAMPKYAELFGKNTIKFKQLIKSVSLLSFLASLPVFLIIISFPDSIMAIFEFEKGYFALIILSIGQLFATFSGSTIHLLNMIGKEKITMYILIISAVINFILNFMMIPVFGINGAAYATASSTVLWNVLAVVMIYRYTGIVTYPLMKPSQIKYYIRLLSREKR